MKTFLFSLLWLFLAVSAFAGTIPITGTVKAANGNNFNGSIRFTLSYSAATDTCSGNIVVAQVITFPVSNGVLPTNARITPNDCLAPAMTWYTAEYLNPAGAKQGQNIFYISSPQFNIGTAVPTPVVTSNISFDLSPFISSTTTDCSTMAGANAGAKIVACIAGLPSAGGIADARSITGAQTLSTNICANIANKAITVLFGAAVFSTTVTQTCTFGQGLRWIGVGAGGDAGTTAPSGRGTIFKWDGAGIGPVLLLDSTRDSEFSNFSIMPGTGTISIAIRVDNVTAPTGGNLSTHNKFKTITIGAATTGVQIGNMSVGNNDLHEFEDVYLEGPGTNGYFVNQMESKFIKLIRGSISAYTTGINVNGGSVTSQSQNFSANGTDIILGSPSDTIYVTACQSERATHFLNAGFTENAWAVTIQGCRVAPTVGVMASPIISYAKRGPLNLIGNDFADGFQTLGLTSSVASDATLATQATAVGNIFPNSTPFTSQPTANLHLIGNTYINAMGGGLPIPDSIGGRLLVNLDSTDVSGGGIVVKDAIQAVTATTNASIGSIDAVAGNYVAIASGRTGTGTLLPMAFFTGVGLTADIISMQLDNLNNATDTAMLLYFNGMLTRVHAGTCTVAGGTHSCLYVN